MVNESRKTLGLLTNPIGNNSKQLDVLVDSMQTWDKRLYSRRLPVTWSWVSYRRQMWPKLDYGLGTNSSPMKDLRRFEEEEGDRPAREDNNDRNQKRKLPLRAIYRRMLPRLGINRNVNEAGDTLASCMEESD